MLSCLLAIATCCSSLGTSHVEVDVGYRMEGATELFTHDTSFHLLEGRGTAWYVMPNRAAIVGSGAYASSLSSSRSHNYITEGEVGLGRVFGPSWVVIVPQVGLAYWRQNLQGPCCASGRAYENDLYIAWAKLESALSLGGGVCLEGSFRPFIGAVSSRGHFRSDFTSDQGVVYGAEGGVVLSSRCGYGWTVCVGSRGRLWGSPDTDFFLVGSLSLFGGIRLNF